LELRLVERAVVELADVADERRCEIRVVAAARRGRGLLAAGAAAARRQKHSCDNPAQHSYPHGFFSSKTKSGPRARSPFPYLCWTLLELDGDLQRPVDDPRLDLVHRGDELLRHGRVDLADAHAAVGERELQVAVALELTALAGLDHVEHPEADLLDPARQ